MNAFMIVKELGLGMEIRLDYNMGSRMVLAKEVEEGVKSLMDGDSEVRKKVKEMSLKAKMAVGENGSSCTSLGTLIDELANGV